MTFDFEGVKVNYIKLNFNKKNLSNKSVIPILFLHGWGGSTKSFIFCAKALKETPCILLDFPPFGNSQEMLYPWTVQDYARLVEKLCKHLSLEKVNIVAHSFGGRVAIEVASSTSLINKLLLTGSAGINKKSLKTFFKERIYKIQKFLSKIKLYPSKKLLNRGSEDYKKLSSVMKKTFVNIVNYDQTKLLHKINIPTLLVWGNLDKETPFYFTKIFKKHIKDCEVITFDGLGHFAYLQKPYTFIQILKNFFKDF